MILVDNRGVCQMKNKKGFTLIELLAVIVILGLLMAIAIPSVTKYITQSRKKTVTSTIGNYIGALVNDVNDLSYTFTGNNTVYAVPIECIALERGGTNPFGAWHQASNAYWAYVLVQYNDQTSSYTYGYTFKDSAGYGLYPTSQSKLNEQGKQIQTGLSLTRPKNGKVTTITELKNWNGFVVNDTTNLVVLEAESEGNTGDGTKTCTLQQKGDNYTQVEQEKNNKVEDEPSVEEENDIVIDTTNMTEYNMEETKSTISMSIPAALKGNAIQFKTPVPYASFKSIKLGETTIPSTYYIVSKNADNGNAIVTVSGEFFKTIAYGTYRIYIEPYSGSTTFQITFAGR